MTKPVSASESSVLAVLSGSSWYSISELAETTGLTRLTVRKVVAKLVGVESSLRSPRQQEQGRPATVYRLVPR